MKNWILSLVLIFSAFQFVSAQQVVVFTDYQNLRPVFEKDNDTTYIVNFFASWCAPCLNELPGFLAFAEQKNKEKVQLILVSLDYASEYPSALIPILENYKIMQTVYLLDDPSGDNWINAVDRSWSGAIPATLFVNGKKKVRKFHNRQLSLAALRDTFNSF